MSQQGPFTIEEMKAKNIAKDTPVWHEGLVEWTIANKIEELQQIIVAKTPPPFPSKSPVQENSPVQKPVPPKREGSQKKSAGKTILLISLAILVGLISIAIMKQMRRQDMVEQDQSTKAMVKNNINSYVTAERSDYQYSEFGGISGLSITVSNSSPYSMDNVRVKVSYIKADGDTWKDEYLDFPYLGPNTRQTLAAPTSNRGTSIRYEIVSIKSSALGLY